MVVVCYHGPVDEDIQMPLFRNSGSASPPFPLTTASSAHAMFAASAASTSSFPFSDCIKPTHVESSEVVKCDPASSDYVAAAAYAPGADVDVFTVPSDPVVESKATEAGFVDPDLATFFAENKTLLDDLLSVAGPEVVSLLDQDDLKFLLLLDTLDFPCPTCLQPMRIVLRARCLACHDESVDVLCTDQTVSTVAAYILLLLSSEYAPKAVAEVEGDAGTRIGKVACQGPCKFSDEDNNPEFKDVIRRFNLVFLCRNKGVTGSACASRNGGQKTRGFNAGDTVVPAEAVGKPLPAQLAAVFHSIVNTLRTSLGVFASGPAAPPLPF